MRKLLLLFALLPTIAFGQGTVIQQNPVAPSGGNFNKQVFQWSNGSFINNLSAPIGTNATLNNATPREGLFFFATQDTTIQVFHNGHFIPFGGGGSSSSIYFDRRVTGGLGTFASPITWPSIFQMFQNEYWQNNGNIAKYDSLQVLNVTANGNSAINLNYFNAHTGIPAGSNTQIQYNNSGAFGASANFIWDNTHGRLNIGQPDAAVPSSMSTIANVGELDLISDTGLSANNFKLLPQNNGVNAQSLRFVSNTTEIMTLGAHGGVRIGDSGLDPTSKLDVNSDDSLSTSPVLTITSHHNTTVYDPTFRVYADGSAYLYHIVNGAAGTDSVMVHGSDGHIKAIPANYYATSAVGGYVPTSRQLTINGTTQDLTANRTWSVGTLTSITPGWSFTSSTPITTTGTLTTDSSKVQTVSRATIRLGTTSAMVSYSGNAVTVVVAATDGTQGVFNYVSSGLTADGGTIFAATGKGSGYWQRQYNLGDGVKIAWWGDNDAGIDAAIACAGTGGKVIFTPGVTYLQYKTHVPLAGQQWIGTGATLQRQTETVVTVSGTLTSSTSSFTVSSVPADWQVGTAILLFVSQSTIGCSGLHLINNISGNVITITGTLGTGLVNGATTYVNPSVWKVWNQIDNSSTFCNFDMYNLTIDGNQTTSCPNIYWGVDIAVYVHSQLSHFTNCSFINMGSDCFQGHGYVITGCYANGLNNSFVHLSADITHSPLLLPSQINNNRIYRSNLILSSTGSAHSEGVITLSATGGWAEIYDNWINDTNSGTNSSLDAFIGTLSMATSGSVSGASRFLKVHDNHIFNCARGLLSNIVADATETIKPGQVEFYNNHLDNCGTNNPFPATLNASWAYIDKITWYGNTFSNGTSMTAPAEIYPVDIIMNTNGTTNIQTGTSINIDGNGTMGGNLSVAGTSVQSGNVVIGTSGQANATISLGIRKIITGATTAYGIYQDGIIQSGVTAAVNMDMSTPSTQAASFTLPILRHYYANGVTIGAGSAVTNQYGFYAESTLTAATNNFGFFSNIAASSGRWNFFGNGSANNAFAGKTYFGPSIATPDAYLKLGAGTASATTAPLKFSLGVNMTNPEAGAVEYDGTNLYFTNSSVVRQTVATLAYSNAFTGANTFKNASGIGILGTTSGTISLLPQAAAGTYNWNYPITAGAAGYVLTSQAGGSTAMTWSALLSKPHTIFTPTTGGTVALINNQYNIINPAGALLALTVNLPSSPANNDCVFIKFTQTISTVTYGNGTVVDGITAPTAGGLTVLTYDSGTTSWY